MQISNDAKNYYKSIGIKFDKSFEKFKTQEILKENISKNLEFFVLRECFVEKKTFSIEHGFGSFHPPTLGLLCRAGGGRLHN